MCSPLKEVKIYNKNYEMMIIRVRKTTTSPEDYKESGRLQRVRKTTKSLEDYKESGRLPESGKLQET
jgi:hypothetical protein